MEPVVFHIAQVDLGYRKYPTRRKELAKLISTYNLLQTFKRTLPSYDRSLRHRMEYPPSPTQRVTSAPSQDTLTDSQFRSVLLPFSF